MTLASESRLSTPAETSLEPGGIRARNGVRVKRAPLRRWIRRAAAGDILAAAVASLSALLIHAGWDDTATGATFSHRTIALLVIGAWPMLLVLAGAYELKASLFGVEELRRILRAGILLVAAAGVTHIVFGQDLSRGYVLALLPLVVLLTALARWIVKLASHSTGTELRSHRVVAVGPAADIVALCNDLARTNTKSLVEVVAYVADDVEPDQTAPDELAHLRRLPDRHAISRVTEHDVDIDLLVRAGKPGPDEMWALGQRAHDLGVTVAIAPHKHDATSALATTYVPLGSTPLLMVETPTLRPSSAAVKAVFDRVSALLLMIALAPVFGAIALAILVTDGRPIFFRQERMGRYGERFQCLKFRTMCPDAEEQLPDLLEHNEAEGLLFKIKDDPRVTRTGRLLRRHSLDELPQFVNVLTGKMSIVGPRPCLPTEAERYDARTSRRLLVKPGITGLWQTEGRSDLPWDDGIYLDLMYVDHWSPLLDLVIMARTLRTILRPNGAY